MIKLKTTKVGFGFLSFLLQLDSLATALLPQMLRENRHD